MAVDWHPILAAVEGPPATWRMIDTLGHCYGTIRLVRRGTELGYSATAVSRDGAEAGLIGYYTSLRGACEATHQWFLAASRPGSAPYQNLHS